MYIYITILILSISLSIAFSADWIQGPRLITQSRDLHENIIIQTLFDNFRAPRSRLKAHVFHTSRRPNLDETVVIYVLFDHFRAPRSRLKAYVFSHHSPTQPSRNCCDLHAFCLLDRSLDFTRISSDRPFVFHENHESDIF